jgi:hypothetical protein
MKRFSPPALLVCTVIPTASITAADITVGTVLTLDREAETRVLNDRGVWSPAQLSAAFPENLAAGARAGPMKAVSRVDSRRSRIPVGKP